jgi:uncharacterized membrane protein YkvA (DUF1232 family)
VSALTWIGVALGLYAAAVLALVAAGRRGNAGALARFMPDCVVLVRRLLGDARVPRRSKLPLAFAAAYLVVPIDLVPDFIPVAGQLDDAIVVGLALRGLLRGGSEDLLSEHWPGSARSLALVRRAMGA